MIPNTTGLINFVNATRADQPRNEYSETLAYFDLPLQFHLFENHGVEIDGGQNIETRVRYRDGVGFRMKGYYESNPAVKRDTLTVYTVPWAHWEKQVSIDTKEQKMNQGANGIVDLMDIEFSDAYETIGNNLEALCVGVPQSDTDIKAFVGLHAWYPTLPVSQSDLVGGFNAFTWYYSDGTATNLIGGRDCSDLRFTRLRRWAGTYQDPSSDQFVQLIQRGCIRTGFKKQSVKGLKGDMAAMDGQMGFAPTTVYEQLEVRVNKFEQSGGGDALGKYDNVRIRSVPFVPVPILDQFAWAPVWVLRLGRRGVHGVKQKGRWRQEGKFAANADSQDVLVAPIVGSGNIRSRDLRGGGFCVSLVRGSAT